MNKGKVLRTLLALLAILGGASAAPAAVLFSETFSYPDGRLASAPPTGGVSGGLWTPSHPLGFRAVYVSGGSVTLHHYTHPHQAAPPPQSVNRGFAPLVAGQTVYAGLDVSASGNDAGHYFAALGTKLFVTPASGGDFTLGIGNGFSNPTMSWGSPLQFNTTYRVVMSYEVDTRTSKLWIDPVDESSTNVSFTDTQAPVPSAFLLRQTWMAEDELASAQVLDNLIVGTTFDDVRAIPAPTLPGDYNGDGSVDAADYIVWRKNGGTQQGYNTWRTNFGAIAGSGASVGSVFKSAIPEPATVLLLLAVGACFLVGRQHGSRYVGTRQ